MLSRSFFSRRTATESCQNVKHKQLPPQVLFETLTHDDQIKLKRVNYLVKHENVLPSLKDGCQPGLAHFGNVQFSIGKVREREKLLL